MVIEGHLLLEDAILRPDVEMKSSIGMNIFKKENLKCRNLRIYQKRKFEMEQFENVYLLLNFDYLEYVNP